MHNTLFTRTTDGSSTGREVKSVGTYRRLVGICVALVAVAVMVLAGCADAGDTASTAAPDTTAPTVSDTSVTAATATGGATVSITVNETGKLFWVLYADGTAPTDAAALIADAGKAKTAPIIASSGEGGQAVTTAGVQTISLSGLAGETNYDFYAVAQDAAGNSSALSDKLDVLGPDTTAPTIGNPSATVTTSGATFSITVNETGTLFWVLYADRTTAPADAAALITDAGEAETALIIANSGSAGQAVTATGVQTISVSNLPNGTDYDFYAVAQDAAGNASAPSTKADVRIALAQAITAGTVTLSSGQISIPVTNSNTGAVRVRVSLSPAKADATYAIGGTAFSNAATTGFTLAASANQTLTVGNLSSTTYTVSLTTVGSNGVAHGSAVSRSADLSTPDAFTVTAANGAVSSSAPNIAVTLSWTNPSNATTVALGALPTGATASPATPNTAAGASNSVTISGLAAETAQTFTVTATNSVGSTTGTSSSITTAELPVVLYEASNAQDGDFGFAYCQTELAGGATDTSGVHKTLYDAGYRTAKFFGATPTYAFSSIATDANALGAVGTRPLVTAAGSSFTAREISSGVAMTLGDFTNGSNYNAANTRFSNATINALLVGLITHAQNRLWSFVRVSANSNYSTLNCSGANSNVATVKGVSGIFRAVNSTISFDEVTCNNAYAVICIAK